MKITNPNLMRYLTKRDQERCAVYPWKLPRKLKKQIRKEALRHIFKNDAKHGIPVCHTRRAFHLKLVPLKGWTIFNDSVWRAKHERRTKRSQLESTLFFRFEDRDEDFDSEYNEFDDWEDDEWDGTDDGHGFDCDCDECDHEWHESNCGELPPSLGGGCSHAGSEYCEFECPFRSQALKALNEDENE